MNVDCLYRAVYCDFDSTLADTNIVQPIVFLRKKLCSPLQNLFWFSTLPFRGLYWLILDRIDRGSSNTSIYKQYKIFNTDAVKNLAKEYYEKFIKPRYYKTALNFIKSRKDAGYKIVLITGGIDIFMKFAAEDLEADCISSVLEEKDGHFTGKLSFGPLTGESKAEALRKHSIANKIDLKKSIAMGDSFGDLEMLKCVGEPIAVNPDSRLRRYAKKQNWQVYHWK